MEGVREKEKGAPLACLLTDTGAWHSVCSRLLICSDCDIIEFSVLLLFFFSLCIIICTVVSQTPCHRICPALVALCGNLALANSRVHVYIRLWR